MASPDVVDLPDAEAVAHFRGKRDRQDWAWSFDWRDVSAEEHLAQFTFAKAARLDVLQAVRAEVDRALAEGRTLREFVGELRPRLQRLGWWGEKEMVDPRTGERRLVEIGPRRLATIFDTNLRMAHARGRWERIQALKEEMPYLRYVATLDARTRPEHARWHGTVLRVDDPWWRTHYPPNGWRCRCAVQQLSEGDLRRRGRGATPRPKGGTRKWTNRRTGEIVDVPVGIDPGFERNAGSYPPVPAAKQVLDGRIGAAPAAVQHAARKLETPEDYRVEGRLIRESMRIDPTVDPRGFRAVLLARLGDERGAYRVAANVRPATGGAASKAAAKLVADASRRLPRSWVEAANAASHLVARRVRGDLVARRVRGDGGGSYNHIHRRITLDGPLAGPDIALHEYVHHLQATLPGFQRVFREEHIRRTTRNGKRDPTTSHWFGRGRDDDYHPVLLYMGKDSGPTTSSAPYTAAQFDMPDGDAQEVATVAHQVVLESHHGKERLGQLAQGDPAMLDLVLGMLFRYDP